MIASKTLDFISRYLWSGLMTGLKDVEEDNLISVRTVNV